MTAEVTVRDRRQLPFFMVPLARLQAARQVTTGARLARLLGCVCVLHELANEQRQYGNHEYVDCFQHELATRLGSGRSTVREQLSALSAAGVVRVERRVDDLGQALPTRIHLLGSERPYVPVTISTVKAITEAAGTGTALACLGLYAVLLEACDEQRHAQGGCRAELTRRALAGRIGLSLRSLDAHVNVLERSDVLVITRRPTSNGNLPNLWDVHEPGSNLESGRAQNQTHPGADPGLPPCNEEPSQVQNWVDPGVKIRSGDSATCATPLPGSCAHSVCAGDVAEVKHPEELHFPTGERRNDQDSEDNPQALALCEALAASLSQRAGPVILNRADGWNVARRNWLEAANGIVGDYPLTQLLAAVAQLEHDYVLGSQIRSMPAFAKRIDELVLRVSARQAVTGGSSSAQPPLGAQVPAWPEAWQTIHGLIRRHGAGGVIAARSALQDEHVCVRRFVEQVGWSRLCMDDYDRRQVDWKLIYRDICHASAASEAA